MVTVHDGLVPLHPPPDQPANSAIASGQAVSVTVEFTGNPALQLDPQLITAGMEVLLTLPVPEPTFVTDNLRQSRITRVGTFFAINVPSPNCPEPLYPQAHNVPSDLRARVCPSPAATETQLLPAPVLTGAFWLKYVPLPNDPEEFSPQAHNVPSDFRAKV